MAAALLLYGCTPPPLQQLPAPEPLPLLPVEQIAPPPALAQRSAIFPGVPELTSVDHGLPITLSAANVDVRALIPVIAEAAGLSVVLGADVEGRISVEFDEIPAMVALRAVLDEAGLTLMGPTAPRPWGPVVFYMLPVNIHDASVDVVQARFGVSREVAEMGVGRVP